MLAILLFQLILAFQECPWCGANEVPVSTTWTTRIASPSEPGDRIEISGTVFQEDGITPAKDVIVYVYHTNIKGVYPKRGNETGNGKRHGYLRGWMITNEQGQYRYSIIRPSPYQTHGGEPAHIHYTIKAPGEEEYWLSSLWFSDDQRVKEELVSSLERKGGFSNVVSLVQTESGVFKGERNIILEEYD